MSVTPFDPAAAALDILHPVVRRWFLESFPAGPTPAQREGWPSIAARKSTLLLAPTGSGKTLAAFLSAIDRLMFSPEPAKEARCRVLYVSPLKALGVDVERNLRRPLEGIAETAEREGVPHRTLSVAVRSGDTSSSARSRMIRTPPDILITTPESLYLLLSTRARTILESVDTVIVDEIHSMVANKRGAHLFVSLERLEALRAQRAQRAQGTAPPTPRRLADAPAPRASASEPTASERSASEGARRCGPLVRIGLSATLRPLDEIARLLGGGTVDPSDPDGPWRPRPVTIVDAGHRRSLDITVEIPAASVTETSASEASLKSVWPSIHPRLLELVRAHRTTMIFVNNRRLAERLAAALNELANEELVLAHHGSIAKDVRLVTEARLKNGELRGIVATSSLELGIDVGSVDLVIQVETPPSVASGLQRIGRAGHHVGGAAKGVFFPKFRGDLLAAAATTRRMIDAEVEETFYLRNPLDLLAQQVVAIVANERLTCDAIFARVRAAAPFSDLSRSSFEGVLDMLSGRHPSDRFAGLKARVTWDRLENTVEARQGAKQVALVNGGTIPDRGLYGVFLAGGDPRSGRAVRVGELDEEMVFESRVGDVFLLGASSWRVEDIDRERVLVSPAPGEPGRMPFWHGDGFGRTAALGEAIGRLTRQLDSMPANEAASMLIDRHRLTAAAARTLIDYKDAQLEATHALPTDETIVFERFIDEAGDWRVCLLSPFGGRVHAAWTTAVLAKLEAEHGGRRIDVTWTDEGMAFRLPECDDPPQAGPFFPSPSEVESLVVDRLRDTSLFAARFRENAGRALLLPKRHPGKRTPLWAQRRRAMDLLGVASDFPEFPILLETYRECLADVFDLGALKRILGCVASGAIRVQEVESKAPSPFASSVLFGYVAQFIYSGDAPASERRAHALAIDHAQLRQLLGEGELRALLDSEVLASTVARLQRLDPGTHDPEAHAHRLKHADALHDLLLSIGDLSRDEIEPRSASTWDDAGHAGYAGLGTSPDTVAKARVNGGDGERIENPMVAEWLATLAAAKRILEVEIGGERRWIAVEDAAKVRDGLRVPLPEGLPTVFLQTVEHAHALEGLLTRYARTHGPFSTEVAAARLGVDSPAVEIALEQLCAQGRLVQGTFLADGRSVEWVDVDVLHSLRQRSLARLRRAVRPVEAATFSRFLVEWQGVKRRHRGVDGLLAVLEQLQGCFLPASVWERQVLPARVRDFEPRMLDELCLAGEIVWQGLGAPGARDGRIAIYLSDHFSALSSPRLPPAAHDESPWVTRIRTLLNERGALFFPDLIGATKAFVPDVVEALWTLVWRGEVTNDTLAPLRSRLGQRPLEAKVRRTSSRAQRSRARPGYRSGLTSRRLVVSGGEGRWSVLGISSSEPIAQAKQLLARYGVLVREAVVSEGSSGGFASIYPVLKAMEEMGHARRGYFVEGLGATQFAEPGAENRLRLVRDAHEDGADRTYVLASTDPANPFGAIFPWPDGRPSSVRAQRIAGSQVILQDGRLIAYLGRSETTLLTFLPSDEDAARRAGAAIVDALVELVDGRFRRVLRLEVIDEGPAAQSMLAPMMLAGGFSLSERGLILRPKR
ncbi:MAG: DEAD/DEAH box helicase [Deltaproteobacteria bacterium]|nr:DEAD/DEAH box helicase [Deltaproteobacteria bacterium]